ncbi:hypothetical protein QQP03_08845, partial [Clostridioides difficile]|nr:hypothetical protein [Clostridioides difficile]
IFTAIDIDNNLSKIEWFIDDVLKETITTDLYLEKTINYELTDNAIHTLKIVATDAENATVEKVLSISKEIMPLQEDASLSDISTKLAEIGEEFRNGKTSIINTLALKNIEASLNNTLVELSEKIKTSFDSSDASVQDLQNRITELNNQLSQRKKWATGRYTFTDLDISNFTLNSESIVQTKSIITDLSFTPSIIIIDSIQMKSGTDRVYFRSITNLDITIGAKYTNSSLPVGGSGYIYIQKPTPSNNFLLILTRLDGQGREISFSPIVGETLTWYAFE